MRFFARKKAEPESAPVKPGSGLEVKPDEIQSRDGTDFWGLSRFNEVYNPSPLFGKRGIQITDDMLRRDAQVKNSYQLRRLCLLATAREIIPDDEEDEAANEQAEFIKYCFKEMDGSVEAFILKMADAIRCGFKVAEIVYRYIDEGPFKGKIGLKKLIVRSSVNYRFKADEHGQLAEEGLLECIGGSSPRPLPVNKFVIWSYGGMDDDAGSLYGRSDFEAAYRYFFGNDIVHRFWCAYLEKYSKPAALIGQAKDVSVEPTPEQRNALLNKFKNFWRRVAIWVPRWATVEFPTLPQGKEKEFEDFCNWNNMMISKALLLGSLIQQEGAASGSYALGQKQFDLFYLNNEQIMRQIEEDIFYEQIIKRLIKINYSEPQYPRFKLVEPEDPEETKAKALILFYLSRIPGIVIDDQLTNSFPLVKIDKRLEREESRHTGVAPKVPEGEIRTPSPRPGKAPGENEYAEFSRPLTEREKIVNFREIARDMEQIPLAEESRLAAAYNDIAVSVASQVEKKNILGSKDFEAIAEVKVNPGKLKAVYLGLIEKAFIRGMGRADEEVDRFRAKEQGRIYQEMVAEGLAISLEGLKSRIDLTDEELAVIAKRIEASAFLAAGAAADDFKTASRYLIHSAIQNDWPLERCKEEIRALAAEKAQAAHTATGLRTVFNRAYNDARDEMFKRTDDVVGYLFSAVLDEVTCFPGKTLIATEDGEIPISAVNPGDMILSGSERTQKVLAVSVNEYEGPMVRIQYGGRHLVCNEGHLICCEIDGEKKFIRAGEIKPEIELVAVESQ